ncbi:2OG-Fe(II) oxygenase [Methylobacterium oryzihabitans]|uniref:Redoxin domain-containing protein n=1 Tax=Methylobacterium oryzihabitans TaxID=2499852 RepID=A0A3S2WCF0_9HYPH|nr:2OG-Fe(II) oxygenase [Methylobacterium oryzihabitans]RVU19145.1 redoxin domain-containing protein [Methylobacterium oryzihabitans]
MAGTTDVAHTYANITAGDPAPWFKQRSTGNPSYMFDTVAGRYVVLCFYGSAGDPLGRNALRVVDENRALFDDDRVALFGVSLDPADESTGRVAESLPGIRHFLDFDGKVSRLYGVLPRDAVAGASVPVRRSWMVLDPTLRVMAVFPFAPDGAEGAAAMAFLRALPPPDRFAGFEVPPPILVIPNVFEADLCRLLIERYERHGGEESGFMREVDGRTVGVTDHRHKRRRDYTIDEPDLIKAVQARILRRVNPEIQKVYAFKATRMERYIVGCYAAEDNAHFRAHRDNTTLGTAHRRFAVSINLNGDFAGGEVSFPEYGRRSYKVAPGGAVIFPCALLHAVSPVTRGRRYAFLPFLYDDEAARLREANSRHVEGAGDYKAAG